MAKHVFWDCDGTLVDSELLAMPAAVDTLISYFDNPATFDPIRREELIRQGAGLHFGQMFDQWWEEYHGGTPDPNERAAQAECERVNVLKALEAVQPIHGVLEALRRAEDSTFTNHVVTSSGLRRVLQCLDATDLRRYFRTAEGADRIYSATDTLRPAQPKPDPAIYFYALEAAGVGPEDAVAIEDSATGVQSAVSAGIPVIGYIAGSHITSDVRIAHTARLLDAGAVKVVTQPSHLAFAVESALSPARTLG